jgi:hypothetical protein
MGILPMCSTGILPVCGTGILPVVFVVAVEAFLPQQQRKKKKKQKAMGGTPMGLMAKMAMLLTGKMPVPHMGKMPCHAFEAGKPGKKCFSKLLIIFLHLY